jgi:hypothetical protein
MIRSHEEIFIPQNDQKSSFSRARHAKGAKARSPAPKEITLAIPSTLLRTCFAGFARDTCPFFSVAAVPRRAHCG